MTILEIINTVYEEWVENVSTKVGENHSMENSTVTNKLPYATLVFLGFPTTSAVLEGQESAITPTIQVDIYTKGQLALTDAYSIDSLSHDVLNGKFGFLRNYGPELNQATDPSITRITSRYTRIIGYGDTLPCVQDSSKDGVNGGTYDKAIPFATGDVVDGGSFNPWNEGYNIDGGTF